MGPLGLEAFPDGEWDCFGKMLANEAHYSSPQHDGNMFCSTHDAGGNRSVFYSFDSHNSNFQHISRNSSISGHNVFIDHVPLEEKINSHGHCNKKPRVSKDVQHCMKSQKLVKNGNEAEETNGRCSSSSHTYTPEEDNASALSLKGKTKATDPQSLNARKRRERINERLRILQNLVPSGTKVDISSMLQEAVHYVKFLQLQIKLLSSDDLWMYAPIAYNELDILLNLTQKSSPPL